MKLLLLQIVMMATLMMVAGCQQSQSAADAAKKAAQAEKAAQEAAKSAEHEIIATIDGEPEKQLKIAVVDEGDEVEDATTEEKQVDAAESLDHEDLDAATWVQTSAEFRAIARQTYLMATEKLKVAKADPSWTAFAPQQDNLNDSEGNPLPPAVILDLDETVLNNGGFQSELILKGLEYSPDVWNEWVKLEQALGIDGAKEFLELCRAEGITTFFVSNREAKVESSTSNNLKSLGMIPADAPDTILSKKEQEGWGSDKTPRREYVAKTHRILMVIGDDLNDFVSAGKGVGLATRHEMTESNAAMWGSKWFVIPNPNYGSWERSLYEFNDFAPRETKLREKRKNLIQMKPAEQADKKAA